LALARWARAGFIPAQGAFRRTFVSNSTFAQDPPMALADVAPDLGNTIAIGRLVWMDLCGRVVWNNPDSPDAAFSNVLAETRADGETPQ
jgi:hypothetical protein